MCCCTDSIGGGTDCVGGAPTVSVLKAPEAPRWCMALELTDSVGGCTDCVGAEGPEDLKMVLVSGLHRLSRWGAHRLSRWCTDSVDGTGCRWLFKRSSAKAGTDSVGGARTDSVGGTSIESVPLRFEQRLVWSVGAI